MHFERFYRSYNCADDAWVVVLLETNALRLTLNNQTFNMQQIGSTPPTKYAAGSVIWSIAGDEATLEDDADPTHPRILANHCRLSTSAPANRQLATLTGTATFPRQLALPEDAVLLIQIRKLATPPDGEGAIVGELRMAIKSSASPIQFSAQFEPSDGQAVVSARILAGDKVFFQLAKPVTISANTLSPPEIRLSLKPVHTKTTASAH
jgi:membrane-bound inhibitor of C-type lysozyme